MLALNYSAIIFVIKTIDLLCIYNKCFEIRRLFQ